MNKLCLLIGLIGSAYIAQADPAAIKIDFAKEDLQAWQQNGVRLKVEDGAAVLTGNGGTVSREFTLTPNTWYQFEALGHGKLMSYLLDDNQTLEFLNLSGKNYWHRDDVMFKAPSSGKCQLKFKVTGYQNDQDFGMIKYANFTPVPDFAPEACTLDIEKIRATRPSPEKIRGFMVGDFSDETATNMLAWGANGVRLQYGCNHFYVQAGKDWEKGRKNMVDTMERNVQLARKHGLRVVIDLHGAFYDGKAANRWFDPQFEKDLIGLWKDIATRLQPYPDTVWGYDLLNEPLDWDQMPRPPQQWRRFAEQILKTIRAIDKGVWIIYEPGPGGLAGGFADLVPLPDYKVIYSSHYYSPHTLTHQGIADISKTDLEKAKMRIGIAYPGVIDGVYWDKKEIERNLKVVDDFLAKYPFPHLLGEFSIIRWAPPGSGKAYLQDVLECAEARNWSWTYHAFAEYDGWSLEYGNEYPYKNMPPLQKVQGGTDRGKVIKSFLELNKKKVE